jgi:glutamate formiminotransferase/formiminotetrahydrofolate cyclodeaminase
MDDRLTDLPANDLIERVASAAPTPGGGSAAALVGATGAALVEMVVALTSGRPAAANDEAALGDIARSASELRKRFVELTDRDAEAYAAVVQARRMPRDTAAQAEARGGAVAAATREATRVPLETAGAGLDVLDLAERLAAIGNRNAISDVGVAALLAAAAARGAILNVRINRPSLDPDDELHVEADQLETRLADLADQERRVAGAVAGRMA